MLRDLTIQNYRCFQDFHIDDLARVNLIVGMNNSGKTSLLEAVYLLVNQDNPQRLSYLLHRRGEVIEQVTSEMPGEPPRYQIYYDIRHLFYGHTPSLEQKISFGSKTDYIRPLQIYIARHQQQPLSAQYLSVSAFNLIFSLAQGQPFTIPLNSDLLIDARWFQQLLSSNPYPNPLLPNIDLITNRAWFIPSSNLKIQDLSFMWNRIALTPEEDKVMKALRILQPDIERISFVTQPNFNRGILLRRADQYPIPIGTMGEGMYRILNLAMAAVTVENGFLLVDEIETGLHYEKQTDMWRFILQVAEQLNIQVFATTHSWDCICAFQEALDELDDQSVGKLFRLSQKGDKIVPVEYTPEELSAAVRQSIEVR